MKKRVQEALNYLQAATDRVPEAAVVLGSGLGAFADSLEGKIAIPYSQIPGWPLSTAPGHAGRLVLGETGGRFIAVMQGRVHYYEGHSMEEVVFPVRVLGAWGAKYYVATNAVGSVDYSLAPGDVVLLYDHINWMGANPLRGPDRPEWNPRFPDMTYAYDRELLALAERAAVREGVSVQRGVYIAFSGPSYETPAEIRMARTLGATVVGMSTVPEVITANAMGMRVAGISCVANYGAGMKAEPLSGEEVLEEMEKASGKLIRLLKGLIPELD